MNEMIIKVRLFATLRDRAGTSQITLSLPQAATANDLLHALSQQHPFLAPALPTAILSINRAFADPSSPIQPHDEVALFPPVSGG